jgi:Spy/CpxP family protein refolding chaperone
MKKVYVVLMAVFFVALTTAVFAFGPGGASMMGKGGYGLHRGGEMGPGPMGYGSKLDLSKEQLDSMKQLRERHRADTQALRDQFLQKKLELRTVYADPKASDAAILAKQKDVDTLQQKMQNEMVQLRLEQRKIFTPEQLTKLGEAAQNFGNGKGRGKGFAGRGFGPGACGRM